MSTRENTGTPQRHDETQETPNLLPNTPAEPSNPTPVPNTQPVVDPPYVPGNPLNSPTTTGSGPTGTV